MEQEITNFARFHAALGRIAHRGEGEDFKRDVVRQFTSGRTDSLRGMTRREYDAACAALERMAPRPRFDVDARRQELRRLRSAALHQMQLLGVDTADWGRVDEFCRNPRIDGRDFRHIDAADLELLVRKLRAIRAKQKKQ